MNIEGLNPERVWSKADRPSDDACWPWTACLDRWGYGRMTYRGKSLGAHRVAYVLAGGSIAPGLTIDHLCRNPRCINPRHMEAVTNAENMARGFNASKTHCKHGHEFTPENTYTWGGHRQCRKCNVAIVTRYKARRRGTK